MIRFILILAVTVNFALASSKEEAQKILKNHETLPEGLAQFEAFSKIFLGLPYGNGGPLGEGPQGRYDQDPLYRFDTFDCTTYVETIVSLALAKDVNEFESQMDDIRYEDGMVDYLKRNHFPSLQWIPNNVRNGLLSEINHQILPQEELSVAEALINLPGWLQKHKIDAIKVPLASQDERELILQELRAQAQFYSPMAARLTYIPIETLLKRPELIQKIPHGTIVNFVRPNWDLTEASGTHMNVSHQGLLFRKGKVLYQRHASTSDDRIVAELPFLEYIKKFRNHPTLKGVHFMKVNF